MMELLIIGGFLFVAYTLAQGNRAQLASGFQPNTLISNTGGRSTVVTGEPNSASPLQLTQQSVQVPPSAVVAPYVPLPPQSIGEHVIVGTTTFVPPNNQFLIPSGVQPQYLGPPVTAVPAISGSTSFTTAADPATGMDGGIVRDLTI